MFGVVFVPVVRLHEAWVARSARTRCVAYEGAAVCFLDHGCEDDALIDERGIGTVLDRVVHVLDHFGGVVVAAVEPAAGLLEGVEVRGPHVLEGDPFFGCGEVGGVALVVGVGVCAGANADAGVVDAFARGAAF